MIHLWARTHLSDRLRPPINLVASKVPGHGRVSGVGMDWLTWTGAISVYLLDPSASDPEPPSPEMVGLDRLVLPPLLNIRIGWSRGLS